MLKFYIKYFLNNRKGQAMTEYGLILALIAVVCIAIVMGISGKLGQIYQNINTALGGAETISNAAVGAASGT